jgi:hypothetical protein
MHPITIIVGISLAPLIVTIAILVCDITKAAARPRVILNSAGIQLTSRIAAALYEQTTKCV